MEAVTPCSVALFPTSYLWAGISIRYGPVLLSCGALFFSFNTSVFTSLIASVGTDLPKEPFGSGSYSSVADSDFRDMLKIL